MVGTALDCNHFITFKLVTDVEVKSPPPLYPSRWAAMRSQCAAARLADQVESNADVGSDVVEANDHDSLLTKRVIKIAPRAFSIIGKVSSTVRAPGLPPIGSPNDLRPDFTV